MKTYRDHYFKRAKQEQYPARSVYKLAEIDKRFHLFKPGLKILDLGAAPGSWTLYAAKKTGEKGRVLAVDLQDIREALAPELKDLVFPANTSFFQEDVFERSPAFEAALAEWRPFDLVLSDMSSRTTGVKFADQARSFDLAMQALSLARSFLIKDGNFVVKVFMGPDVANLATAMRESFRVAKSFKPQSSRTESKETFYIGIGFKAPLHEKKAEDTSSETRRDDMGRPMPATKPGL